MPSERCTLCRSKLSPQAWQSGCARTGCPQIRRLATMDNETANARYDTGNRMIETGRMWLWFGVGLTVLCLSKYFLLDC